MGMDNICAVHCAFDPCDWEGLLTQYKEHILTCEFVWIECANEGCSIRVCKQDLIAHLSTCPCQGNVKENRPHQDVDCMKSVEVKREAMDENGDVPVCFGSCEFSLRETLKASCSSDMMKNVLGVFDAQQNPTGSSPPDHNANLAPDVTHGFEYPETYVDDTVESEDEDSQVPDIVRELTALLPSFHDTNTGAFMSRKAIIEEYFTGLNPK